MEEAGDIKNIPLEERTAMVHKIHVVYPRLKEIYQKIAYCHRFSVHSAEPECMFIFGPTGAGKTTVCREYLKRHPRTADSEGVRVPVLTASIPSPATVKSLATKLLFELGDPLADRGTTSSQTLRLTNLIKACGVEMIILDELQHFIDRDSQKVLRTVSDWLKTLILDTGVPIVLVGLPEAEGVLESNPQLSRRFANRHYLQPFSWDTQEGSTEFRKFLHAVESRLPFKEKSHLADIDLAERFFYASDGVVAYVMKLIRYGTHLALQQRIEKLDHSVLAASYQQHVSSDKPGKVNPFSIDQLKKELYPDKLHPNLNTKGTNSRIKGKREPVRASDVLR